MPATIQAPQPEKPTTGENAAKMAKANQARKERENAAKGAVVLPRSSNPCQVRSLKHDLRDPETMIWLNEGQLTELPFVSGWVMSQIKAGLIEVVNGDPEAGLNDGRENPEEKLARETREAEELAAKEAAAKKGAGDSKKDTGAGEGAK